MLRYIIPVVSLVAALPCVQADDHVFAHDVESSAKPWSHEEFRNDPQAFQFAVLTDRTGGMRQGVFAAAVDKMNMVQPEFVMSVGDYIEGYTTDGAVLREQWREMDELISRFEMPFFALPGNHDITNPEMQTLYEKRFGRRYYAFVYKDVLFMCLDTQDTPVEKGTHILEGAGLLPEQVTWAREVLGRHRDVRWTFLFMHQPLWLYEETAAPADSRHPIRGRVTGWAGVEAALGDRDFTVFAGHLHRYTKYERRDRKFFVLATTGGGSDLLGPGYGQFDHAVWVTMAPEGPRVANLLLDGIRSEDVYTEHTSDFRESLQVDYTTDEASGRVTGSLNVRNPFHHPLHLARAWTVTNGPGWRLASSLDEDRLGPGESKRHVIVLEARPGADLGAFPTLQVACAAGSELNETYPLGSPLRPFLATRRPRLAIPRLAAAPVIDGRISADEWAGCAVIPRFMKLEAPAPAEDPVVVRCGYDADHLYVAGRLTQDPGQLRLDCTRPNESLWEDDSIELFFDPNLDGRTHAKAIITAANVVQLDQLGDIASAVGRVDDGWTFEARIPWRSLGDTPPGPGDRFGFNPRRNRSLDEDRRVSEWNTTLVSYPFAPDLYGIVELE